MRDSGRRHDVPARRRRDQGDDTGAQQWEVSYTYPLSKRTLLYTGYVHDRQRQRTPRYNFNINPITRRVPGNGADCGDAASRKASSPAWSTSSKKHVDRPVSSGMQVSDGRLRAPVFFARRRERSHGAVARAVIPLLRCASHARRPRSSASTARCARSPASRTSSRPMPGAGTARRRSSTPDERRHAAGLMRVNHTGEVCAQALYAAQALVARDPAIRQRFAAGGARGGGASRVDAGAARRARRPRRRCSIRCGTRARSRSASPPGSPATASTWASSSRPSARSRST